MITANDQMEILKSGLPYRILFLDIDGVMNNSTIYQDDRGSFPHLEKPWFIPRALKILRNLVALDGWHIVISSTWRHGLPEEQFALWFNLPGDRIIGKTPSFAGIRGEEITAWLKKNLQAGKIHPKTHIAILDDNSDMEDWQRPFFVQTEWDIPQDEEAAGLNWEHYQKIKRITYQYENGYIEMKDLS